MADDDKKKRTKVLFQKIELPDGGIAYQISEEDAEILSEIVADRKFWDSAIKRAKGMGTLVVAILAGLSFLAMWWPWITRMMQIVLTDVPK